jgi:hypothetical protein
MKVVLLRVGIDTGSGGIHAPLFKNGSFEFIPIPDDRNVDERTYGSIIGSRYGRPLIEYFPESRQRSMINRAAHVDPEFETFTYGDPTSPKAGLRHLQKGDLLVFYCGLEGWDFTCKPALYIIGYFEVLTAGYAADFCKSELYRLFEKNFHVRHQQVYLQDGDGLVLVKGSNKSRLLKEAVRISVLGHDKTGKPLKILSPEMQKICGDFGGKVSIQRSPPRWVDSSFVARAAEFVKSLK